jgi:cytochrome c-type biogenesis protein CcmH/NrfG
LNALYGKAHIRRGTVLVGALALLLLLRGPALMSAMWGNVGMLLLRDGLMTQPDFAPGTYPVYRALAEIPATGRMMQSARRAVALDGDNLSVQWALGRAALAVGDVETAADALRPLMGTAGDNPLLYYDVLTALSYAGRHEDVITLYESSSPMQHTQAVNDAVALAYLERVREAGGEGGEEAIERAAQLRPADLYVNYYLWRTAMEAGDVEAGSVYSETLVYFPWEAIHPVDERLLSGVADAVPDLLAEGLWDRDKTLNVISFLMWQHSEATGVERLLERLIERYPTEPDWLFYLAELYYHRGDLERAEVVYRQVVTTDPEYVQAYLRLGMVSESRASGSANDQWLQEAIKWYRQVHEMASDDLLGLKRLAEACAAMEGAGVEDENCHQAAERVLEDQRNRGVEDREDEGKSEVRDLQFASRNSPAEVLWTEWLEQVATAEPEHLVAQELDSGWTFLGYDVDENRLIRGEPVDLLLYWVGPVSANAGSEQDGWYRAGERWGQVLGGVQNLVLNGGFELGIEAGSPMGFPFDLYHSGPDTGQLVANARAGHLTTVALLDNKVYGSTSLVSTWVPVNPDKLYLQAGSMKSVGGNGYLGRRWAGDVAEGVRPYGYVAAGVRADDWRHYAGVTRPLEGVTGCQVWLLNYAAMGRVYFDNVSFVEVGLPGR